MKKSFIYIIIVTILILGGAIFYSYWKAPEESTNSSFVTNQPLFEELNGPEVMVDPPSHDFGRVKYGDVAEHIFAVKNTGNQVLVIESVTSSCACTSGKIEVKEIEPGKEADLVVNFDPAIHKDDSDLGELTRTVYISTNDPLQEEIEVKIYADVYK